MGKKPVAPLHLFLHLDGDSSDAFTVTLFAVLMNGFASVSYLGTCVSSILGASWHSIEDTIKLLNRDIGRRVSMLALFCSLSIA